MKTTSRWIALWVCALSGLSQAQSPVIEISGANFRPLPLAVVAPAADPSLKQEASELDRALLFDLSAAGIFQILDRKSFLSDPQEGYTASTIQFSRWSDTGADALVKVRVVPAGDRIQADLHLFTIASGKEDLNLSLAAPGGQERRLAHQLADALFRHYTREMGVFTTQIAFVLKTPQGKDVWIADWDGHNAQAITHGGINLLPVVTPDGKGVAYTSFRRGKPELYVQRPNQEPTLLVQSGSMVTGISYRQDGKKIAYSMASGDGAQIWVADADGSGAQAITNTPFFINSSPSWSPDGKWIAFVSNRGGSPQIYAMTSSGANVRRLTFQGNYNQTPKWSPRGDLIAFTARDERNAFDLFTVSFESGKINRLTQDQGNNREPSFAPNGRLIVFESDRRGSSQLYVMSAEGQNQLPLEAKKGELSTPSWGPLP